MKVGYARVSTDDQNLSLQRHALEAVGCTSIHEETVSGVSASRPVLAAALASLQAGDELVVWRLDRLGRSLSHLIQLVQSLGERGVGFVSLNESIDTKSAGGRLVFHMMGALAEFERSLIIERTKAGLDAAKRKGKKLGRRPSISPAQLVHARKLIAGGERPEDVAKSLGVGRSTIYRALHVAESEK